MLQWPQNPNVSPIVLAVKANEYFDRTYLYNEWVSLGRIRPLNNMKRLKFFWHSHSRESNLPPLLLCELFASLYSVSRRTNRAKAMDGTLLRGEEPAGALESADRLSETPPSAEKPPAHQFRRHPNNGDVPGTQDRVRF